MKRSTIFLLPILALSGFALFLHSCQKEVQKDALKVKDGLASVTERAPNNRIYGVTLYDGVNPCDIVVIDQNTGNAAPISQAWVIDAGGNQIMLENLKGICVADYGTYFLTTGIPANPTLGTTSIYNNALFKVDPTTGECSYASTSTVGTVSDLEYYSNRFFGLRDNNNRLISIGSPGNNFSTYNQVNITGVTAGFTMKGLSLVNDSNGFYLVGCATNNVPGDMPELYKIDWNGVASLIGFLDPASELGAGHCAIGHDIDIQNMLVNRSDGIAPFNGLNRFPWPTSSVVVPTGFYGAQNFNFEDITSWNY